MISQHYIKSGNYILNGLLSTAYKGNNHLVLFCHGLYSHKETKKFSLLANMLSKKGVSSFCFDFVGHGESGGSLLFNFNLSVQIFNINRVKKYLEGLGFSSFSFVGSSLGATALFSYITSYKLHNIKSLCLIAPRFDFPFRVFYNLPFYWLDQFKYLYPRLAIKINIPTLFILAKNDQIVANKTTKHVISYVPSEFSNVAIIEANHSFASNPSFTKLIALIDNWLQRDCYV